MFGRNKVKYVEMPGMAFKKIGYHDIRARGNFFEAVHVESRIKYIYVYCGVNGGSSVTITPMLNPDGTPALATEDEIKEMLREGGIDVE